MVFGQVLREIELVKVGSLLEVEFLS